MTEIITITIGSDGKCTVYDGKLKGSREWYYADGLLICKFGSVGKYYERFANLAYNEALARHIPTISLRRIGK